MSLDSTPGALCDDINTLSAWLALDNFDPASPQSPQVIVLLGNQAVPTLTAACQLAHACPRATLLFSGGLGHATTRLFENLASSEFAPFVLDGRLTAAMGEAQMYAAVAEKVFSISRSRIRVENQSANGGENARFSQRLLQQEGLAAASVLLLQDPLMQRRSLLTWQRAAEVSGLPSNVQSRAAFVPRVEPGPHGFPQLIPAHARATWTFPRFLGLLLGEIARLHDDENGYGPRGKNFLPHLDIPAEVWASYQRLLANPLAASAAR